MMTTHTGFHTRTGEFPIGFRRVWSDWQKSLPSLLNWAENSGFFIVDLGRDAEDFALAEASGVRIGSGDLLEWQPMLSSDHVKSADAIAKNRDCIERSAPATTFA